MPTSGGREITLADLASHKSGLRRDPKGMPGRWLRDRHNPYAVLSVGQPYGQLVRERICLPLGIRDTFVTPSDEQAARLAANLNPAATPLASPLERIQRPRHRLGRAWTSGSAG
jgi:CubicO group peptidase (beta-lactamase class C family)